MDNREVKFRAWNGTEMRYDWLRNMQSWMKSQFYTMQYTGLKGKNGKEIYEGDLLKHTKTEAIGEVVWYGAEWGIRWEPNSEYPAYNSLQDCWTTLHYEVIGNKFENPEPLED